MTMSRSRVLKALPYAVVLLVAAFLYFTASNIEFQQRAGTLGPDFWPKAIVALLLVTCAFEVGRALFAKDTIGEVSGVLEEIVEESAEQHAVVAAEVAVEHHPVLLALGIAATLAYVALVTRLGFFLSTALYLAGFLAIGGYRRWGVIAAVSGLGALLLMFIFMKVVYVSLPIGEAPFSAVTLLLMQLMGIR
ncbi:MAG: hypothetical protein GEV05_13015 [Betaproteobacteria bacterium]|nr:hypothetical protein [Betaproteobacteria bacterium]